MKDAVGGGGKVIKLAATDCPNEGDKRSRSENEGEGQDYKENVHIAAPFRSAGRLAKVLDEKASVSTVSELTGISTAATRG